MRFLKGFGVEYERWRIRAEKNSCDRTDNFSFWAPKEAKNRLFFSLLCILILSIHVEYAEYFVSHKCLQSASLSIWVTQQEEKNTLSTRWYNYPCGVASRLALYCASVSAKLVCSGSAPLPAHQHQRPVVRVRGSYFGVILSFTAECGNYFTNCGRGCHKRCPTRTNQKDLKRKLIIFSAWISNLTMKFYHHNLENKISTYIETTNTDAIYSGFRFSWLDLQFFEANL